jgi:hypothetical protein
MTAYSEERLRRFDGYSSRYKRVENLRGEDQSHQDVPDVTATARPITIFPGRLKQVKEEKCE